MPRHPVAAVSMTVAFALACGGKPADVVSAGNELPVPTASPLGNELPVPFADIDGPVHEGTLCATAAEVVVLRCMLEGGHLVSVCRAGESVVVRRGAPTALVMVASGDDGSLAWIETRMPDHLQNGVEWVVGDATYTVSWSRVGTEESVWWSEERDDGTVHSEACTSWSGDLGALAELLPR